MNTNEYKKNICLYKKNLIENFGEELKKEINKEKTFKFKRNIND